MDYLDAFFPNYCILSSKNDRPLNNKMIVYNYSCRTDNYKDILVATKLMLLYNCKIFSYLFITGNKVSKL